MLKEIKVGETYVGKNSRIKKKVKYIGDLVALYEFYSIESKEIREFAVSIEVFKKENEKLPKEPKKLGQLYMCYQTGDVYIANNSTTKVRNAHDQPVTNISEKGEAFSVEG